MISRRQVARVKTLELLSAFPTRYEGRTEDGRTLHVRFRGGWLSVELGEEEVYRAKVGDDTDATMPFEELTALVSNFVWPDVYTHHGEEFTARHETPFLGAAKR